MPATLSFREVVGETVFECHRTPRSGSGVRRSYTINGKRVTRRQWMASLHVNLRVKATERAA